MTQLIQSLTITDPSSVLPLAQLLKAVRERLPGVRRDELIVSLATGGYSLLCSGEGTYISGIKLA